ncbi:MAG: M50 family metallopeptidase [Vulcanimicrobiaceae bacterium]
MLIGRIFGIPLRVDWSWIIVFTLFVVMLSQAGGPFETIAPQWRLGVAAITVLLLFVCVLIHEASHASVGRLYGIPTHDITLFAFGGVSHMENTGVTPGQQAAIAAAGPLASFAIAAFSALVAYLAPWPTLAQIAGYLALMNVVLGVFNLLPSYPLDGGRIVHALVWKLRNSRTKATEFISVFSTVIGFMLMGFAVLLFFTGAVVSGIWIALIAWFVMRSAKSEWTVELLTGPLGHTHCADVMDPVTERLEPDVSCSQAMQTMLTARRRVVPITHDERLLGLVTLSDFGKLGERDPNGAPVSEVMTPYSDLIRVAPSTTALDAVKRLGDSAHAQLPVVDASQSLQGFVTRETFMRILAFAQEQRKKPSLPPGVLPG